MEDEVLEWAVQLAMESRRKVQEQLRRVRSAEFCNTQFRCRLGKDEVKRFVANQHPSGAAPAACVVLVMNTA